MLNEPLEKTDQHLGSHGLLIQHKTYLPLIGHRRDHVDRASLRAQPDYRRLALRRVTSAMLTIAPYPGLIASMDLSRLSFRTICDFRIRLIRPLLDFRWTLFISPLQWLLRVKSPKTQMLTHCADRHPPAITLLDEFLHRLLRPQGKVSLYWSGVLSVVNF